MEEVKIDLTDRVIFEFTPEKLLNGDGQPVYAGKIKIALPNQEEKYVYFSHLGIASQNDMAEEKLKNMKFLDLVKLAKSTKHHLLEIDITRISTSKKYDTFSKMFNDVACEDILTTVVTGLVFGEFAKPGNASPQL